MEDIVKKVVWLRFRAHDQSTMEIVRRMREKHGLSLHEYAVAQKRARRVPEWVTEATLLLCRFPALRRRTLRVFSNDPRPFEGMLAALAGRHRGPLDLARPGLRLLGGLLTA